MFTDVAKATKASYEKVTLADLSAAQSVQRAGTADDRRQIVDYRGQAVEVTADTRDQLLDYRKLWKVTGVCNWFLAPQI